MQRQRSIWDFGSGPFTGHRILGFWDFGDLDLGCFGGLVIWGFRI